jgi:macrolide transport system ATP-binding/permease protein
MRAHRLRTFLTMLGIIIGIASVVSVVALGEGSRRKILKDISSIGTNTVDIYPGKDSGDVRASAIHTLIPADAEALEQQTYVDSATPAVSTQGTVRFGDIAATAMVTGVGENYFRVHGTQIVSGLTFDRASVRRDAQEVVIDDNTRQKLFVHDEDPLGKVILIGNVPCRVIGVAAAKNSLFTNAGSLTVWIPYTTAMIRILGQAYLRGITVRIADSVSIQAAEQSIARLLRGRHGTQDFYLFNTDIIRQTIQTATATLTLLISAIALISLIVGGIGVMNIMLVSVTERTREIGVRMAVGARQSDIMKQFLIEAVLVCLMGGALGIVLALCIGVLFDHLGGNFTMAFSSTAMIAAVACSTLIGITFGYLPARNAARLDPIEALARD